MLLLGGDGIRTPISNLPAHSYRLPSANIHVYARELS